MYFSFLEQNDLETRNMFVPYALDVWGGWTGMVRFGYGSRWKVRVFSGTWEWPAGSLVQVGWSQSYLADCFQLILFSPLFGGRFPNLTSIVFKWVGSTTNQRYIFKWLLDASSSFWNIIKWDLPWDDQNWCNRCLQLFFVRSKMKRFAASTPGSFGGPMVGGRSGSW